jgi:hypothetical protein
MRPVAKPRDLRRPPRENLDRKVFVRLTKADVDRIERIAASLNWSRGEAIRAAIRAWFQHHR